MLVQHDSRLHATRDAERASCLSEVGLDGALADPKDARDVAARFAVVIKPQAGLLHGTQPKAPFLHMSET